ncbi:MAG: M23 family metallopeptidase [Ignavibacteriaceae bacterium]|nr:M23 family metallopeptidase [Ignavibacteriaceae bacterium]
MKSATRDIKIYFFLLGIFSFLFLSCKEESNPVTQVPDTSYEMKVTFAPIEVKSTDGKINLLYSVEIPNFEKDGYTLKDFQVLNAANNTRLCSISDTGKYLLIHPPTTASIPEQLYAYPMFGHATYRFSIGLVLDPAQVPQKIKHRLVLLKDAKETTIEAAETAVSKEPVTIVGAPFKGNGFVSECTTAFLPFNHHPTYQLTYKGMTRVAERYCVDWLKVDSAGNLFHGDKTICSNWYVYGQNIYAATAGEVVFVQDGMPDQSPVGTVNDVNLYNGTGNSVTIMTGVSYAVYGHMIANSITVKLGEYVNKGQLIGRVGNSGNSNAPHLHFGIHSEFPYYISEGLPYYIDSFEKAGLLVNPNLEGGTLVLLPSPSARTNELMENCGVYNFK